MTNNNNHVENKLLSHEAFLKLDKLLNRFNIFEASDMGRREVKHTKFLSYLLNPNESHGLGESFLKNFITRLSVKCTDFPRIFDLDLAFAQVKPEYNLNPKRLDCLIRIPYRKAERYLYLAIENKIYAGQGDAQLGTYTSDLAKKGFDEIFKFYLTFHHDDPPNENSWVHITYEEIVLPSVKSTIDMLEDTGSIYLKTVLQDYYDLMYQDSEIDNEIDQLASDITSEKDLDDFIKSIKVVDKPDKISCSLIEIKHPKTINFLTAYDRDERKNTLLSWMKLKTPQKLSSDLEFSIESSSRSWLRFSLLTESNRNNLLAISDQARPWLESKCPISYEVILKKNDNLNKFQCQIVLVLGPLNNTEIREALLKSLGKYVSNSEFWTRLETVCKSEVVEKPFDWVISHIFKQNNTVTELSESLSESATKLNLALNDHFRNHPLQ